MKKKLKFMLSCVVLVSAFTSSAMAEKFGVCTHMGLGGIYNNDLNVNAAGEVNAGWIRDEARWAYMQDAYDKPLKIRDKDLEYIKKTDEQGINQLLIIGYSNAKLKENGVFPKQDDMEYYNAFLDYVRYTVSTVKDYVDAYEFWNEPNIPNFNYNMLATGEDYAKLCLDVKAIVDELDPTAPLLCGAITGTAKTDLEYGKRILEYIKTQGDVNELVDAFSLHNYSNQPDEGFLASLELWEKMFDDCGYNGDVWLTECGVSSNTGNNTEKQQAEYVAKLGMQWENFLKENNRNGKAFWYDLKNDGTDIEEYEHNLGLLNNDYSKKPAFYSMQAYNNLTADKKLDELKKVKTENHYFGEDEYGYVAKYSGENDIVYIVYDTNDNGVKYSVPMSGDVAFVYDYLGNITETIDNPSGIKSVEMEVSPKIVECRTYKVSLDADYDDGDGILRLDGMYNGGNNVTVELLRDGTSYKTFKLDVKNGKYNCWLSVLDDGSYTVKVGMPELVALGKDTGWAEKSFSVKRKFHTPELENVNISYDAEKKKVSISGSITDFYEDEYVTVVVIPDDMDPSYINESAIGYIAQIPAVNGDFRNEFILPDYFETKAKIYIGGTGIDGINADVLDIAEGKYLYVKEIDLTSEDKLSARAVVRNFTETDKKATLIIAQYDEGGKLLKIETVEKTVGAKTYGAFDVCFDDVLKESRAKSASTFIFSDLTGFVPLAESDKKIIN